MITIRGIRLDHVQYSREGDKETITGSYSLLSSDDRVLAKQTIGGYQGMDVKPSAETIKKFNEFLAAYKADVNSVLGLEGGE